MPKAFVFTAFGDADTQEFQDHPIPTPGPSELLVQVKAAGVNPVDWKIRSGLLGRDASLPAVLGVEVSGVVRGVGQDVDGFGEGDEVFGTVASGSGGYAEYTLLASGAAAKKPTAVSFTDAATLSVAAATAWDGIEQLGLSSGQTLLINGISGGVGVAAAQIARDRGVAVFGTGSEAKRDLVEPLGATLVASGDGVADRVRELLPGGVDGVLDLVGGQPLREVAALAASPTAVVSVADPVTVAELGGQVIQRDGTGRVLARVADLVAGGKLDPHVTDVRPLDEAAQALHGVESGHSRGKVVLHVS